MSQRMVRIGSSVMLLLCLLGLSAGLRELRDPVREFSIENRQDSVREITAAHGHSKFPKQDRQASQRFPARAQTSMEDLKTSPEPAKQCTVTKKEFEPQPNSKTRAVQTIQTSQAENQIPSNSLLQRFASHSIDSDVVFQAEPRLDNCTAFYGIDFRDEFPCRPCQCYFTYNRNIVASCSSPTAEINAVLPNETRQLTISKSSMKVFQVKDFLDYHGLYNLSVTNNIHLSTVANITHGIHVSAVKWLDLSYNSITDIMDRSFSVLPHLLSLNLGHNNITYISRLTFAGLDNLRLLNLSRNQVSVVKTGSFDHFRKLEILDLNSVGRHLLLVPGVFSKLATLHTLYVIGDLENATRYPSKELARLTNLNSLSIDGISSDAILGPEIKILERFITLHVGLSRQKECRIKTIKESFLVNVPNLKTIRFSKCPLANVDINVYKNVPKLRSLEFISTNPYDIFRALDGLRGLQNSSLKSLSLVGLIPDGCPFICLYGRDAKYLSSLELEVIDLSENRIGFMDQEFIHGLPQTLRKLVIRGNELIEPALLTDKLFFLKHLETLDLGTYTDPESSDGLSQIQTSTGLFQVHVSSGLVKTPGYSDDSNVAYSRERTGDHKTSPSEEKSNEGLMYENSILQGTPVCSEQSDTGNRNDTADASIVSRHSSMVSPSTFYTTPPKTPILKYLLVSGFLGLNMKDVFHNITVHRYTNVKYVDFSNCALPSLTRTTHIPPWIEAAHFNGNYFKHVNNMVFQNSNSLAVLSLSNNVLGDTFALTKEMVFTNLYQLAYLDLSMNMIYELSTNFFEGLHNLRILIMRDNKLGIVNTNFSTTPMLEYLDLRKNSITWISKSSRDDLDIIATNHTLYVELTSNPLRCTCEGLEVLHWIWASNIYFVSKDFLRCVRDDGSVEDIGNIEDRVTTLQRQCAGKWLIIVLCVASLAVVCFLVVFGVMYRFRWQLRYIRHIALSRLVGFKPRESTSSAYKFDAFIVYSDMSRQFVVGDCLQELEVKRGHKLCVDDRDFMPGTLSVSAIVSAIQNSRKTVLILSPDFYDEQFSEYSVKMALMEEIYQKRSVLYLCVYRPLPDDEMSKSYDLLMVMKRNNYLEFPPEADTSDEVRQIFWDQLSEKIGRSAANECPESAGATSSS